ncbi:MAG: PAS domain S-box protein [Methanobacteriaceae archaeon]|nr:PAS domain S-box protein [Methanobacteriaceae archaeon]
MLDEKKSREELLDELNKLRTILKSKEESTRNILEKERFLSQTSLELVDLSLDANLYEFIAKKLNELVENSVIVVTVYDPVLDSFKVRSVAGRNEILTNFSKKFLGADLIDLQVSLADFNEAYDEESRSRILSGKLHKIEKGLYQVLCGTFPKKLAKLAEITFDIGDIYGTGFKSKGKLYGTVNIFLKKRQTLEDEELIQSLINLFAVAMQRRKIENDLEESERKYRKIFENVQDVFYQTNINGNITEISPSIERYSGFSRDYLIGRQVETVYKNPEERKKMLKIIKEKGEVNDFEITLQDKFGKTVYASVNAHFLLDDNGQTVGIEGSLRDITQRKKTEQELIATQHRLRIALDLAKMGSWEYDVASDTFTFDDQFYSIYGTTVEAEGGSQMSSETYAAKFIPPEEASLVAEEIERVLATDDPNYSNEIEHVIIRADGEKRCIIVRNGIEKDEKGNTIKVYGANQDITERKKAENEIKKALKEKEMLLKEIHHRVKNNLMVISSLLNLQSRYIQDEEALDIFRESQNRAKSMAIIHERLYRSTDLKRIDFGDYIRTLSTELYRTYVPDESKIKLNLKLEDLMVDINTTVPLGLILNELLTNSMKHAFPSNHKGRLTSNSTKKMMNSLL